MCGEDSTYPKNAIENLLDVIQTARKEDIIVKFMISWKITPGHHKLAGESFLKSGAPMPDGLTMIGRWHAPGSAHGWVLVEGNDPKPLYEHITQWANLLELQVTPVVEDSEAAQGMSKVYGK